MILLSTRNLTKRFGGLSAINDLSLDVKQGEIMGLIGPNGAGKSTVFNVIGGTFPPTSGKCFFKDNDITRLPAHRRSKRGIARVFQGNVLFRNLPVMTNVLIGSHMRNKIGFLGSLVGSSYSRNRDKAAHQKVLEVLSLVKLSDKADELAGNLSHGDQRLLCLAVALISDPELLLLDEPVTGMNSEEVTAMVDIIRMLSEQRRMTSIVIEHNMQAVMNLCNRIAVISYGRKIAEGSPEEITKNPAVIEAYLGAEHDVTQN
jgi:branched-chain amino acid transport system ATP-binding protein